MDPIFLTNGTVPRGLDVRARKNPDTGEVQIAIGGAHRLSLSDFVAAVRYVYGLDLPIEADDDPRQAHIHDLAAAGKPRTSRKNRTGARGAGSSEG